MTAVLSSTAPAPAPADTSAPRSRGRRWYHNITLVSGLSIVAVLVLAAVFAPLLTHYNPIEQDLTSPLLKPGGAHLLGTDQLGRDVWSRLLYGARTDLRVGFIAVLFPFILGTFLGCLAGYFGGWVDTIIMRLVDIVVAFPFYVLIIALVFVLGPGTRSIYIAITLVGWVAYTRLIRGELLIAKRQEYVQAAHSGGLPAWRIIAVHLLPNVITQALVFAMSDIVMDILAIVTLGYLGLGVAPPTADWGAMIVQGQDFITSNWELCTFPGIAVVVTGLGLSLVGDGLADVLRRDS